MIHGGSFSVPLWRLPAAADLRFAATMPQGPYIREKFTRERNAARKLAVEYFRCFPKDRYQTQVESWRPSAIAEHRIHDETAAGADRGWRRAVRWLIAAGSVALTIRFLHRRASPS